MRLNNSPRFVAAVLFLIVALTCGAILYITIAIGSPVSLSSFMAAESPARAPMFCLISALVTAIIFSVVLFSSATLNRRIRLFLLIFASIVPVASVVFAQLIFLVWLFPLWHVFRFYRDSGA
jgi:hypothetical protein